MLAAGRLNKLVQFRRREALSLVPGTTARPFVDYGEEEWAQFEAGTPFRLFLGDVKIQLPAGTLTVRDYEFTRTITPAHRFVLDGVEYQVRSVNPGTGKGMLVMDVMEASGRPQYAADMDQNGDVFMVRRPVPNGAPIQINVRGRAFGYRADELVGGIDQGDRRIVVLAADVEQGGLENGIQQNDSIWIRGTKLNVQDVDDNTHRIAGELLAYVVNARG